MTELVEEETEEVVIVNVALEAAAGITTLAGTCAAAVLELVSVTVAPPLSAGPLNVTVPCEVLPLTRWSDSTSPMPPWEFHGRLSKSLLVLCLQS